MWAKRRSIGTRCGSRISRRAELSKYVGIPFCDTVQVGVRPAVSITDGGSDDVGAAAVIFAIVLVGEPDDAHQSAEQSPLEPIDGGDEGF